MANVGHDEHSKEQQQPDSQRNKSRKESRESEDERVQGPTQPVLGEISLSIGQLATVDLDCLAHEVAGLV